MKEKFSLYQENGVREYWIVSPAYLHIQVFELVKDQFVNRSTYHPGEFIPVGIFPGFELDCGKLFSEIT
jgi:Uma2 family endonuclease